MLYDTSDKIFYDTSDKIFYDTSANNNLIVQAI
jgi:hypothetical protein